MSQKKGFSLIRVDADVEALEEKVGELEATLSTKLDYLEKLVREQTATIRDCQYAMVNKVEAAKREVYQNMVHRSDLTPDFSVLRDLLVHQSAELDEVKKLAQIRRRRKGVEEEEEVKEPDAWDRMIAHKTEEQKAVKVLEGPGLPTAGAFLKMTIVGEKHPVTVQIVTKEEMEEEDHTPSRIVRGSSHTGIGIQTPASTSGKLVVTNPPGLPVKEDANHA